MAHWGHACSWICSLSLHAHGVQDELLIVACLPHGAQPPRPLDGEPPNDHPARRPTPTTTIPTQPPATSADADIIAHPTYHVSSSCTAGPNSTPSRCAQPSPPPVCQEARDPVCTGSCHVLARLKPGAAQQHPSPVLCMAWVERGMAEADEGRLMHARGAAAGRCGITLQRSC